MPHAWKASIHQRRRIVRQRHEELFEILNQRLAQGSEDKEKQRRQAAYEQRKRKAKAE